MSDQDTSSAAAGERVVEGATARVETPRLDALLRRLKSSLSRGVLLHGLGASGAAWRGASPGHVGKSAGTG